MMEKKREELKVVDFVPKSISEKQKKMDIEKDLANRSKEDREFIERFRNLWNNNEAELHSRKVVPLNLINNKTRVKSDRDTKKMREEDKEFFRQLGL